MNAKHWIINVLVVMVGLFLQACAHSDLKFELLPVEESAELETLVTVGKEPFATITLENGVTLKFVDSGDDHVGIVERIPREGASVLLSMIPKTAASPLEIYLAVKPENSEVPKALLLDHKRQMVRAGKANAPPRKLSVQSSGPGTAAPPVIEPFECDSFGINWKSYWNDTFEGVTDFHPVGFTHQFPQSLTFYPGSHVYAGTGTNRITYLGACNGDVEPGVPIEVHRWGPVVQFNPSPQPPTVTWQWLKVAGTNTAIGFNEKYVFYSGNPNGRFRALVSKPEEGQVHEHFGIGAAYSKSFFKGIGF